jgi:hypothetical protein
VLETPDAVEDGPVVLPLSLAVERHPELVEPHLGTLVEGDLDVFTAANDADWTGGAFVYVPRGVRVDTPILLTAIADCRRHRAQPPHADRPRGRRRGGGLGAVPVRLRGRRVDAQHRSSSSWSARTRACATSAART